MRKMGNELTIGDEVLDLWWQPKGSRVLGIRPYTGRLTHLFPKGASIVTFVAEANRLTGKCEMTVDHGIHFKTIDQ